MTPADLKNWRTAQAIHQEAPEAKVARLTAQLAELRQAFDTYAGIAEPKIAGLEAAAAPANQRLSEAQDQRVRNAARSLCERFYEGLPIDVAVGNLQAELDKGTRW